MIIMSTNKEKMLLYASQLEFQHDENVVSQQILNFVTFLFGIF